MLCVFFSMGGCIFSFAVLKYVAYDIFSKEVIATQQHLGHSFKKLHFLMDQAMNRRLQQLDLTSAQGHIIGFLACSPEPPCARDLETAFGLTHATVSGLLSRMESKGFIALTSDPHDRRIKRIHLLDKGRACSREIRQRVRETELILSEGFSGEELECFRAFLSRAIRNMSETTQSDREE